MTAQPSTALDSAVRDVIVVGGGINGCGIARDLAGRGLRVTLVERDDLAAHTSSSSTKLIHGGLRYLEHREFSLVRKSLLERELLLKSAPHLMGAMRFVMPYHEGVGRPAWMIRLGLFLYDHLARREWLPGSDGITLTGTPLGAPLQPRFTRGFEYSDGWVDDARLVVACALDAQERGAEVLTRTEVTEARREAEGVWHVKLQGGRELRARMLVNAAGPWAAGFLKGAMAQQPRHQLRLVRGSHIVVSARFDHDHAYLFQNEDGRIIFAIPYRENYTLIGTTDEEVQAPGDAHISTAEIDYLCAQASRYFRAPVRPEEVRWTYGGVRPLIDDAHTGSAQTASRDYLLDFEEREGESPLLTVWGGKLTTFRKLAEEASNRIAHLLGSAAPAWTGQALLPGGDLSAWIEKSSGRPDVDFERFVSVLIQRYAARPEPLLRRLARAYGGRVNQVLDEPGREIAPGLLEGELRHLVQSEWAQTLDDVLWRRSKLGLVLDADQQRAVGDWLAAEGLVNARTPAKPFQAGSPAPG